MQIVVMRGIKFVSLCLLFVILWSSGWIGSKFGQEFAGTFTLLTYRYFLVVVVLLIYVIATQAWRRIPPKELRLHCCVGVFSHALYLGAGNSAMDLGVTAGMVALITALQPMIVATLSSGITGERSNSRQWYGLILGFSAVLLVISDKIALGGSAFAYSLPFIAIFGLGLASLIDRRISLARKQRRSRSTPLSLICLIHCSCALVVFAPFAIGIEGMHAEWGKELLFSIVWLALIVSLGAYCLLFYMLRLMSAVRVSSLEFLAPPMTMLLAYFVFGERLSHLDLLGLSLATVGIWLVIARRPSEAHSSQQTPDHQRPDNISSIRTGSFAKDMSLDQTIALYPDGNIATSADEGTQLQSDSNSLIDLIDLVIDQQEKINTLLSEAEQRETAKNLL